jgi:heme-degrading monooxygenase HmoA
MPGIRDAFLLVNRTTGKAVTVTLWDSEEAVTASTAGASQMRQQAAGSAGGSVESVEVFEVALHLAETMA